MNGSPKDRYKVAEKIPITISLTNTSSQPVSVCVSSDLYQDRPTLTKDNKLVPIMQFQSDDVRSARLESDMPAIRYAGADATKAKCAGDGGLHGRRR